MVRQQINDNRDKKADTRKGYAKLYSRLYAKQIFGENSFSDSKQLEIRNLKKTPYFKLISDL